MGELWTIEDTDSASVFMCVYLCVSVYTCWHDGRYTKVGESSVLKLQGLFTKLHLHATLKRSKVMSDLGQCQ